MFNITELNLPSFVKVKMKEIFKSEGSLKVYLLLYKSGKGKKRNGNSVFTSSFQSLEGINWKGLLNICVFCPTC